MDAVVVRVLRPSVREFSGMFTVWDTWGVGWPCSWSGRPLHHVRRGGSVWGRRRVWWKMCDVCFFSAKKTKNSGAPHKKQKRNNKVQRNIGAKIDRFSGRGRGVQNQKSLLSWERLTRKQTSSRPEKLWPEMWKHMSDASKRKEKQKWAVEKWELDHVRSFRGIYFIDPKDEEFKDIMKNAHRKSEIPMPAAMPCNAPINSSGENDRVLRKTRQNVLNLTSVWEFDWKESGIMKIILQLKG